MIVIEKDDLSREEVVELLKFHTRDMAAHSPEGTSYALDISALKTPDITVFTIWESGRLAGCAALREINAHSGEIKSMRTAAEFERRGIGRQLLQHLITAARESGYSRLSLETGTTPLFHTAIAFYASAGFILGEPFGDYAPSRYNIFMHLDV